VILQRLVERKLQLIVIILTDIIVVTNVNF